MLQIENRKICSKVDKCFGRFRSMFVLFDQSRWIGVRAALDSGVRGARIPMSPPTKLMLYPAATCSQQIRTELGQEVLRPHREIF